MRYHLLSVQFALAFQPPKCLNGLINDTFLKYLAEKNEQIKRNKGYEIFVVSRPSYWSNQRSTYSNVIIPLNVMGDNPMGLK